MHAINIHDLCSFLLHILIYLRTRLRRLAIWVWRKLPFIHSKMKGTVSSSIENIKFFLSFKPPSILVLPTKAFFPWHLHSTWNSHSTVGPDQKRRSPRLFYLDKYNANMQYGSVVAWLGVWMVADMHRWHARWWWQTCTLCIKDVTNHDVLSKIFNIIKYSLAFSARAQVKLPRYSDSVCLSAVPYMCEAACLYFFSLAVCHNDGENEAFYLNQLFKHASFALQTNMFEKFHICSCECVCACELMYIRFHSTCTHFSRLFSIVLCVLLLSVLDSRLNMLAKGFWVLASARRDKVCLT